MPLRSKCIHIRIVELSCGIGSHSCGCRFNLQSLHFNLHENTEKPKKKLPSEILPSRACGLYSLYYIKCRLVKGSVFARYKFFIFFLHSLVCLFIHSVNVTESKSQKAAKRSRNYHYGIYGRFIWHRSLRLDYTQVQRGKIKIYKFSGAA